MRLTRSNRLRASLRERGVALALALAIELLVALLLWFLAPPIPGKEKDSIPSIFGIAGARSDSEEAERKPEKASEHKATSGKPRPTPPKPVEPPPPAPEPPAPPVPSTFIRMTRSEYKAADIAGKGTVAREAPEGETAAAASETGSQPGDTAVVGKAPNGEPLYAAEWYRRPTHAELAPYISARAFNRPGEGIVVCRMIANHLVEDCQELGESPRGSGYAGSVRQAAWQFRVRAPRVGGREKLGTWVQIRITYTITADKSGSE